MQRIYLFDVDGTLTHPQQQIDEDFASIFLDWKTYIDAPVYLVTGSDLKKIKQQIFEEFLNQCDGVFTCSANELWVDDQLEYRRNFRAPKALIADLELYLLNGAAYHVRTGNHIERRPGMINFSVLGRNANLLQREAYTKWDKTAREREDIVDYITGAYPTLDVVIGGSISVDIYPKGRDKAQVVQYLRKKYGEEISLIFVGDRNVPGGNDWPLAQVLEKDPRSEWIQVNCYEETRALIEYSELFI